MICVKSNIWGWFVCNHDDEDHHHHHQHHHHHHHHHHHVSDRDNNDGMYILMSLGYFCVDLHIFEPNILSSNNSYEYFVSTNGNKMCSTSRHPILSDRLCIGNTQCRWPEQDRQRSCIFFINPNPLWGLGHSANGTYSRFLTRVMNNDMNFNKLI